MDKDLLLVAKDYHLRNHGFILSSAGWRLSPLYDVNPVPYGDTLALNVSEEDNSISIDLAIETAAYYGISLGNAKRTVDEITSIVRGNWERLALEYGLSRGAIEHMRPAFLFINFDRTIDESCGCYYCHKMPTDWEMFTTG